MDKKKILSISFSIVTLALLLGLSYAFVIINVNNDNKPTANVGAATLALTYTDCASDRQEDCANITASLKPGDSVTKTFQIENTGTENAGFELIFKELANTFVDEELVYKIENIGDNKVVLDNTPVPYSNITLTNVSSEMSDTVLIGETIKYRVTITFLNTDYVQSANATASFRIKLGINPAVTNRQMTLASLGLMGQVKSEPTNYNMFDYTWAGYQYNFDTDEITKAEGIGTTEGLYAMEDDFGTSYYFRGSKSLNNIVKFGKYDTDMYYYTYAKSDGTTPYTTGSLAQCQTESTSASSYCTDSYKYASAGDDMYWRIVRINGDGTLRLMYIGTSATATGLNSYAGRSHFNYTYNDRKYSGYTYDNSAPNVQDGVSSDIKNYLDTWYARSMSSEDANIATGQFYSDTTGYEYNAMAEYNIYSPYKRLYKTGGYTTTVKPTLKTGITTETYGGIYNLKVGLLNVDEIVMSGYDGIYGSSGYDESGEQYPYTTNTDYRTWTFSPAAFADRAGVFLVNYYSYVDSGGVDGTRAVRPVINLSAEYSQQLRGLGSTASPYTVS